MVNRINDFFDDGANQPEPSLTTSRSEARRKQFEADMAAIIDHHRKKEEMIREAELKQLAENLKTAPDRKAAQEKWAKIGFTAFILAAASVVAKVYTGSYLGPFGQETSSVPAAPAAPQPR